MSKIDAAIYIMAASSIIDTILSLMEKFK